ncbi:MAG: hypothetical protein AAFQ89_12695 [Cyanobacteria bacterium J06626_18]
MRSTVAILGIQSCRYLLVKPTTVWLIAISFRSDTGLCDLVSRTTSGRGELLRIGLFLSTQINDIFLDYDE